MGQLFLWGQEEGGVRKSRHASPIRDIISLEEELRGSRCISTLSKPKENRPTAHYRQNTGTPIHLYIYSTLTVV